MNGGQIDTFQTDFSETFGMVDHRLLTIALRDFGIGGSLLKWFTFYLPCRSKCVVLGNSWSFTIIIRHLVCLLIFENDLVERLNSKILRLANNLKVSRKIESVRVSVPFSQ